MQPSRKPAISPDTYNGTTSLQDYLAHFEVCADVNFWNNREKARFLADSLRGSAQWG